jgi:hypothetical protein
VTNPNCISQIPRLFGHTRLTLFLLRVPTRRFRQWWLRYQPTSNMSPAAQKKKGGQNSKPENRLATLLRSPPPQVARATPRTRRLDVQRDRDRIVRCRDLRRTESARREARGRCPTVRRGRSNDKITLTPNNTKQNVRMSPRLNLAGPRVCFRETPPFPPRD